MMNLLRRLVREEGQGLVEYALIIVGVALIAFVGIKALGGGLNTLFDDIKGAVEEVEIPDM